MAEKFHDDDMLRLAQLEHVWGRHRRTISRRKDEELPPYVLVGEQRRWRYDYVKLFIAGQTELRGLQKDGYPEIRTGAVEAEPAPPTLPPADVVFSLIAEWEERERWRRANDILTRLAFRPSGMLRFADDRRLYDLDCHDASRHKNPSPTEEDIKFWIYRIDLEIKAVFHEIGLPWLAPFGKDDDRYHIHIGALNRIGAAFRKLYADEKRWRERAELGAYEDDMPLKPPR